jgi:myo-inositol-1(or 4)-monophosphatase
MPSNGPGNDVEPAQRRRCGRARARRARVPAVSIEVGGRDLAAARALAVELAEAAGRLQVQRRATVVVHEAKAHANDLVSDVDHASERLIVDGIRAVWPDDGVLGEEGSSAAGTSGWRWVIDPLDGTRNYLTATGPWSVCIALQRSHDLRSHDLRGDDLRGDDLQMGVVHDPMAGETFSAVAAAGATLGAPTLAATAISASDCARVDRAVVGLSFNPSPETKRRMAGILPVLLPAVGDIRRIPAALCLCYLAAGRLDAGLLVDTKLWDVAAGLVVAAEAGVVLGGVDGVPAPDFILAAAPAVAAEYAALLSPFSGTAAAHP